MAFGPVWLFATGFFTAVHYPIAQAQAYRALPERSTLVAAAGQPFIVFDVALPLAIGLVSDAFGVLLAAALLLLQPFGLLLVCGLALRLRPRATPEGSGAAD
jgi:fucose permease